MVLILTSAIYANSNFLSLVDSSTRLFYTLESLFKWHYYYPDLKIVLCDGSGYDFSTYKKYFNSNVEFLSFENSSDKTLHKGKGFGEGEIINFAIKNSFLLENEPVFIKCTAKLFVENFSSINLEKTDKVRFNFSKTVDDDILIDTRFYLSNKLFYINNISMLYLDVNDSIDVTLERVYGKKFFKNDLITFSNIFVIPPIISGMSGTTACYSRISFYDQIKIYLRHFIKLLGLLRL